MATVIISDYLEKKMMQICSSSLSNPQRNEKLWDLFIITLSARLFVRFSSDICETLCKYDITG